MLMKNKQRIQWENKKGKNNIQS